MSYEQRSDRPPREDGGDRPQRPQRPRFGSRRKVCRFCADHIPGADYKDVGRLRVYISDRGKIEPRRKTGTCQKHQRLVCTAIKRARHLALLPYTLEHVRQTGVFPIRG
jgi:small subunit ribosomal protein S18